MITIGNKNGQAELFAKIVSGAKLGVLVAEGVLPNASHNGGQGINVLVSTEVVAPNGGVAYHDTAVWIKSSTSLINTNLTT